jgi:xanthine dehydrogenase accessory factor
VELMDEILNEVRRWLREGRTVALATLLAYERSSPRMPGAAMAVNDRGEVAGSVSGGCVEGDLYERLQTVLRTGEPGVVDYGISDEQGFAVGLSCGGTIHVFVERLPVSAPWLDHAAAPGAIATVVRGPAAGARLAVTETQVEGGTGDPSLDAAVTAAARDMLAHGRTGLTSDGAAFVLSRVPPARLFVFGAVEFSRALAMAGRLLGYHVVVADARPVFATADRFPEADEVVCRWPHEVLEEAGLGPRDAVCVLTHDLKFDVPALKVALRSPVGYVGALGSRRTQARRREALLAEGLRAEELDRVAAPIGLDIGADTPAEFAVAVLAEIVALAHGRAGGRLTRPEPAADAPRTASAG